jgi:hypothetical protein
MSHFKEQIDINGEPFYLMFTVGNNKARYNNRKSRFKDGYKSVVVGLDEMSAEVKA